MPDVMTPNNSPDQRHMRWSGYAGLQKDGAYRGSTPLKAFVGNFATSTMMTFQTIGDASECSGVVKPDRNKAIPLDLSMSKAELGYVPRFPLKEALQDYMDELWKQGSRG